MQFSDTEFSRLVAKTNQDFTNSIKERGMNRLSQGIDIFIKKHKLTRVSLNENNYPLYYDGTRYFKDPDGKIYRITTGGIYLANGRGARYDKKLV